MNTFFKENMILHCTMLIILNSMLYFPLNYDNIFLKYSNFGFVDVQFHVQGDLSGYTKEFIREVIETVAAILDCKEEDIHLNAVRYSTSFFISLAIKKVYIRKLLALKEQDRLNLNDLNIDYLKIDKETIYLNKAEGKYRK